MPGLTPSGRRVGPGSFLLVVIVLWAASTLGGTTAYAATPPQLANIIVSSPPSGYVMSPTGKNGPLTLDDLAAIGGFSVPAGADTAGTSFYIHSWIETAPAKGFALDLASAWPDAAQAQSYGSGARDSLSKPGSLAFSVGLTGASGYETSSPNGAPYEAIVMVRGRLAFLLVTSAADKTASRATVTQLAIDQDSRAALDPASTASTNTARSVSYNIGYLIGALSVPVGIIAVIVVVISRRRSRTPPAPPGFPPPSAGQWTLDPLGSPDQRNWGGGQSFDPPPPVPTWRPAQPPDAPPQGWPGTRS